MRCLKSAASVWLFFACGCLFASGATKKDKEKKESEKAIQALLVTGGASHDYEVRKEVITRGIRERVSKKIEWMVRLQGEGESDAKIPLFESPSWAEGYDIVVHDYCFPRVRDTAYVDRVLAPHQGGIPAVLLHGTMHSFRTGDDRWFDFCGITSRRHDENYPLTITPKTPLSAIWGGLDTWMTPAGQLYLVDALSEKTKVLGTALARGTEKEHAVVWQHRYGPAGARVFGMTPGNDLTTMVQPEYLDVLARGFLWALDKAGEDGFKPVAPEASLSGFTLPIPAPDLPAVGAKALPVESASIAMAGEMVASSPWDGMRAVDRDSRTSWMPEKAGPVVWQGKLKRSSIVGALTVVWDNPPELYALSTSLDGIVWEAFGPQPLPTESPSSSPALEGPAREARWLRLDILKSGKGFPSGIREVAAYEKGSDVPAGFRIERDTPKFLDEAAVVPLSLDDNRVENEFRLRLDWNLEAIASLSPDTVVKSITATTSGSAFLLVDSVLQKEEALSILHCMLDQGDVKTVTFLEGVSPQSVIGWDGEWLYIFDGTSMVLYRDTNGDGVADERHPQEPLFSEELSDEETPVNRVFHEMVVAPDGWIYVSFSQDVESEAFSRRGEAIVLPRHGILRFTRDLEAPELLVSSSSKIQSFLVDNEFVKAVSEGAVGGFYSLPAVTAGLSSLESVGAPVPTAVGRGSGNGGWLEIAEDIVSGGVSEDAGIGPDSLATIPGLQHFSLDGLNNGWFVRPDSEGLSTQIGVISPKEKVAARDLDHEPTMGLIDLIGKGTDRQEEALFFELQRRKRVPVQAIEAILNDPKRDPRDRIFALQLLNEIDGENALTRLGRWTKSEEAPLRKVAFDLLGNERGATNHEAFSRISDESDPAVTASILAGIFRTGSDVKGLDRFVLKLAATPDATVSETASAFLVRREETAACFDALDDPGKRELWPAAFDVLSRSHRKTVVEGLGGRLARTTDPGFRDRCLSALCRLYALPSGETWEASDFVGSLLRASLSDRRVNKPRLLDEMLVREIPFLPSPIISLAKDDLTLEPFVVDWLMSEEAEPEVAPWLKEILKSDSRDPILKRKALVALAGIQDGAIFLSLLEPIGKVLEETSWVGDQKALLERRWRENPVRTSVVDELIKVTKGKDLKKSQLAWEPLLLLRDDLKSGGEASRRVVERIDEVLFSKKSELEPMLLAMERVESFELPRALAVIESGNDEALKVLVGSLQLSKKPSMAWTASFSGAEVNRFLADARALSGDPVAGYKWFKASGCGACHNIHGEGSSLGPDFAFETGLFDLRALFESVTDPAAEVPESFVVHTFEMKDGARHEGANVAREGEQISFIDTAGNRVSIPASSVHREWIQGDSLMPRLNDGMMTSKDLADLKAFLDSLVAPGLTTGEVN
ncbi:MAG: ThuA domain-containing protein [Verrucomicrobiales bacterium]|nr:ThuA domain-containing protein [Verrucomicrobiales bacterium]